MLRCHFCGHPIDPRTQTVWRRVEGWERKATGSSTRKGGSDIACRERRDEVACEPCIGRLRSGIAAQQGSLV